MLSMTVESALYQSESGICSSASTKGECLKCKQDRHCFNSAFQQDQNLISFYSLPTQSQNSPLLVTEEAVTQGEVWDCRIRYFGNQSATTVDADASDKTIRVNRMNKTSNISYN